MSLFQDNNLLLLLSKAYLIVRLLVDLFILTYDRDHSIWMGSLLSIFFFVLTVFFFVNTGIDGVYQLFKRDNMASMGVVIGLISIPVGFEFTRILFNSQIKKERKKDSKLEILAGLIFYSTGSFLLFFLFYTFISIFNKI